MRIEPCEARRCQDRGQQTPSFAGYLHGVFALIGGPKSHRPIDQQKQSARPGHNQRHFGVTCNDRAKAQNPRDDQDRVRDSTEQAKKKDMRPGQALTQHKSILRANCEYEGKSGGKTGKKGRYHLDIGLCWVFGVGVNQPGGDDEFRRILNTHIQLDNIFAGQE